jgi:hypothetical protein
MELKLRTMLDGFVQRHSGMRQRGDEWRRAMGTTVGGSELAAVMGRSQYSDKYKVAAEKAAALQGRQSFVGGPNCWWGSLFQDVAAAVVALDLGGRVVGDDICVREVPGHRNSPDGYILARLVDTPEGPRLWSTDQPPPSEARWVVVLLEIKCPTSRLPRGRVPRHYVPQLWSGLAVSPAHFGLFVDAVFRKCSLEQLGPGPEFDVAYHGWRDIGRWDGGAFAWGVLGVYEPEPAAPTGEAGPAGEAGAEPPGPAGPSAPLDLGGAGRTSFDQALEAIDQKRYRVVPGPFRLADGRGAAGDPKNAVWALETDPPPGFRLFGVLPWKLMVLELIPVGRRPGFLREVAPLIAEVHRLAAAAAAERDPASFLRRLAREERAERAARSAPAAPEGPGADPAEVQDFFDSLGVTPSPPRGGSTAP